MKNQLKATTARTFLTTLLIIVMLASAGGFYFGLQQVRAVAVDVTHASQDASAGNNQVQELQELQLQLEQTKALVEKADTMFAPVAGYQGRVLTDIKTYATASGLTVTTTEFGEAGEQSSESGETRLLTITLGQPVSYTSLLRFLQLTEGSIPKITVNGIKITRIDGGAAGFVTVDPITLRISVK